MARWENDSRFAVTWGFTPNFADVGADGLPDRWLISDFGRSPVFRSVGDGRFEDASTEVLTDENGTGGAPGNCETD